MGVVPGRQRNRGRSRRSISLSAAGHGAWMLAMPVTTEAARHYGFELFGFPKSVESITVERLSRVCTTTVSSDGSVVLRTRVQLRPGLKRPVPWCYYTKRPIRS